MVNVPEGCEDGQDSVQFVSKMLMEVCGPEMFDIPLFLQKNSAS